MPSDFPPTILVVDDNRLVRELIRDTFVEAGFSVITAADGREAIQRVSEERPDLVVTDVAMPGMDGWQLCEHLKSDPHTRDVPLVFLSTEREVHQRLRGLRLGAYDYLCKPFSTEELLVRVRTILERVRSGSPAGESGRAYLAGHTSHLPVPDLVQLLAMNAKTGTLRLRGRELGRIHVREGRIVGAFTARVSGRKALFRMLAWTDADFHFDPQDDTSANEELENNTQRLLMDAAVAIDDLARIEDALPGREARLRPTGDAQPLERSGELGELGLGVLREARAGASLRQVFDRLPDSDVEIARAVARLIEVGALATIADDAREAP